MILLCVRQKNIIILVFANFFFSRCMYPLANLIFLLNLNYIFGVLFCIKKIFQLSAAINNKVPAKRNISKKNYVYRMENKFAINKENLNYFIFLAQFNHPIFTNRDISLVSMRQLVEENVSFLRHLATVFYRLL